MTKAKREQTLCRSLIVLTNQGECSLFRFGFSGVASQFILRDTLLTVLVFLMIAMVRIISRLKSSTPYTSAIDMVFRFLFLSPC